MRAGPGRTGLLAAACATAAVAAVATASGPASPGTLVRSFGTGGRVQTQLAGQGLFVVGGARRPRGGLVVAGNTGSVARRRLVAIAYRADGSLDRSFGRRGVALGPPSRRLSALAMTVQRDGKVLVVARGPRSAGSVILRFTRTGRIDRDFGRRGLATGAFRAFEAGFGSIALAPDGKIVVAGTAREHAIGGGAMAAQRFTAQGRLDRTFGAGGSVRIASPGRDSGEGADAVLVQRDGRIVVVGDGSNEADAAYIRAVRLLPDGTRDPTYGSRFRYSGSIEGYVEAAALDGGDLLVAGLIAKKTGAFYVTRLDRAGVVDRRFGRGRGSVSLGFARGTDARPSALSIDGRGRVTVAGGSTNAALTRTDFAILRLKRDGSLDRTFGSSGRVRTSFGKRSAEARVLVPSIRGTLLVAGSGLAGAGRLSDRRAYVARYRR